MINADSLEVEVSSIGTIEGEVSSANSIEGELNNTTITADIKLQEKSVTPSTSQQNVVFDSGYNGLSKVVVNAVDSSIDSDIKASNIKTGVNILGVTGTLKEYVSPKLQSKSATPKTTAQTINADSSYDGLSSVSISAVDNSIDSNIKAGNIKSGVSILGITGTLSAYTEPSLQNKTITPSTSKQTISADASYDGLGTVTVNAVTSSIDSDIKATNIRKGIDILGITGTMEEYVAPKLQEKTVSPSTSSQSVTPDSSYDGLSKVTVNAMATTTQATPSISVSSSGLITASSTQTAGYVSAGTKSSTKQLTTKGATTYTPNTSNQTISSGTYLTGTQTIKGDSNLVASNIKKNVSIFGVTGTLEEGTTEDLTSEFNQYETYLGTQETTIDNIITALQGKTSGGGGSIETVTFTVQEASSQNYNQNLTIHAQVFENGNITTKQYTLPSQGTITLENVVVGATMSISSQEFWDVGNYAIDSVTCSNSPILFACDPIYVIQIGANETGCRVELYSYW